MNQNTPNDPNKTAVALNYNPNEPAPKVIATGRGYLADKIIMKAQEEQIPIHQDAKLASNLSVLDIGEYIPKSVFKHNPNFYYTLFSPIIFVIYLILYPDY